MLVSDLIAEHAAKSPNRTALIFRNELISYAALEFSILTCAQGLTDIGIKKGSTFALIIRNCPEFVILVMALSKIGAVAVPINFQEKPDRLTLIMNDAKVEGVLTSKEFYRHVVIASKKVPSLKHFYFRDGDRNEFKGFSSLLGEKKWDKPNQAMENDLIMLLYTSGTTGQPKGVMLTHKNFLSNAEQCLGAIKLTPRDRFLCLLPLFHSFAWTTCMLIPMKLGAISVIIESLLPFDPIIKAIWKHRVTLFVAVPQIYAALTARIHGVKALILRLLNPIRACISGAAPMPEHVHREFEKTFGIKLLEGYGLTEASPVLTFNLLEKRKIGTVGPALPGIELELRDDNGKKVPPGEVGEIYVRGDNVMKGYYNQPEETHETLTSDGWLITGDMGKLDKDGYLTIVDRKKDLIIVKGLNIYPLEVETVLMMDPGIKEVAVVGKVDPTNGDETVRAFITIKEGQTVQKSHLFDLCREHLASYKMPKEIIVLDEMPKNALQKILKKELRKRP